MASLRSSRSGQSGQPAKATPLGNDAIAALKRRSANDLMSSKKEPSDAINLPGLGGTGRAGTNGRYIVPYTGDGKQRYKKSRSDANASQDVRPHRERFRYTTPRNGGNRFIVPSLTSITGNTHK